MTRHSPPPQGLPTGDAPRQLAQLREVLLLVRQIAGRGEAPRSSDSELDEAARIGSAYGGAVPIVQRRFDALVAEAVAWAAAGVDALTRAGGSPAAAERLADELDEAVADILKLINL